MALGDTHGNHGEINRSYQRAKARGVDAIVQVGDYGYWDHADQGAFSDLVSHWALKTGIPFFWVDGNHENHTLLRKNEWAVSHEGFWEIRPDVFYIPRGTKWEWDGVTMMGVGGAVSIDADWRRQFEIYGVYENGKFRAPTGERTLWWPEEELTWPESEFVLGQGQADVLFTHDCPSNAPFKHRLKDDPRSTAHRAIMDEIGKSVQPRLWFHGHMHEWYDYTFPHDRGEAHVIGLECDGMKNNWTIFDTHKIDKFDVSGV